jgi:hypothetical protein
LYKFLKKYGLDRVGGAAPATVPATVAAAAQTSAAPPDLRAELPVRTPALSPAPPFCSGARATRARS